MSLSAATIFGGSPSICASICSIRAPPSSLVICMIDVGRSVRPGNFIAGAWRLYRRTDGSQLLSVTSVTVVPAPSMVRWPSEVLMKSVR